MLESFNSIPFSYEIMKINLRSNRRFLVSCPLVLLGTILERSYAGALHPHTSTSSPEIQSNLENKPPAKLQVLQLQTNKPTPIPNLHQHLTPNRFLVSCPLVLLGTILGRSYAKPFHPPTRVSQIPRQIPEKRSPFAPAPLMKDLMMWVQGLEIPDQRCGDPPL